MSEVRKTMLLESIFRQINTGVMASSRSITYIISDMKPIITVAMWDLKLCDL